MTAFRFALFATAACLGLAGLVCAAHAQDSIELAYDAPDGCPGRMEFVASVEGRGGRFGGDGAALRVRGLVVSIAKREESYIGSLRVEGSEGASDVREVHAGECAEVSEGLAVIAAITLGPQGRTGSGQSAVASEGTDQASTGAAVGKAQQQRPSEDAAAEPRLRGSAFGQDKTLEVAAGTMRFDGVAHYTLMVGGEFGFIPSVVLPRYDFVISRANFVTPPSAASRLVGQVLQVDLTWLGPATHTSGDLATRAYGTQAALRSCAGLTYDMDGLTLLGCAEFGLG